MMNNMVLNQVLSGMVIMGYLVASVFFLRFWRSTHESLFRIFAAAFFILAIQRSALALTTETVEDVTYLFVIRLIAYLLIAVAIIVKNRTAS
jgi:hypothetical protein